MLISIIVPIYCVEKYLDKCIQSIVGQTYENLEIILVNDGSPDNCPQICECWAKKDSRIQVVHKINGGLSDARNVGMTVAKGKYIAFIDSDDYIEKDMYEKMYRALQLQDADMVICNIEKVTEFGEVIPTESPIINEVFSGKDCLYRILKNNSWYYVTVWNKLYKKEVLDDIEFPLGKINEDEFVIHEILFKCTKIISLQDKLYKYVQREGSIMNASKKVKMMDAVEAVCQRVFFCQEHGLTEYYQDLAMRLKKLYIDRRVRLSGTFDKKEKRRIKQIDQMFRRAYFVCVNRIQMKEYLLYMYPKTWWFLRSIIIKLKKGMQNV